MTILLYAAVAVDVFGLWPLPGLAAVLAAWWLDRRTPRAQLWRSWLRRGTAMESVSGPAVAIVVQAVAFGVLHIVGVANGIVGAAMAGSWGPLLGLMRWRTRGLLAPYVAHMAADATIFCMLLPGLR